MIGCILGVSPDPARHRGTAVGGILNAVCQEFRSESAGCKPGSTHRGRIDFDRWIESLKEFQIYEVAHNCSLPLCIPGTTGRTLRAKKLPISLARWKTLKQICRGCVRSSS